MGKEIATIFNRRDLGKIAAAFPFTKYANKFHDWITSPNPEDSLTDEERENWLLLLSARANLSSPVALKIRWGHHSLFPSDIQSSDIQTPVIMAEQDIGPYISNFQVEKIVDGVIGVLLSGKAQPATGIKPTLIPTTVSQNPASKTDDPTQQIIAEINNIHKAVAEDIGIMTAAQPSATAIPSDEEPETQEKREPPLAFLLDFLEQYQIGVGGKEGISTETAEAIEDKNAIRINLASFGSVGYNEHQKYVNGGIAGLQVLGLELFLRKIIGRQSVKAYRKLMDYIRQKPEKFINAVANLLSVPIDCTDKLQEYRENLHPFFKGLVSIAHEALMGGVYLEGLKELNDYILDNESLGRKEIPLPVSSATHELLFGIPERIFWNFLRDYYYVYHSLISLRNMNMALGMYRAGVELSYAKNLKDSPIRATAKFGAAHMGVEKEFQRGYPQLVERMKKHLAQMINYYAFRIGQSQTRDKKKELLTDFLYIVSNLSIPESMTKLRLDEDVILPESGLTLLWEMLGGFSNLAQDNEMDESTKEGLSLMTKSLGALNFKVTESVVNENENRGTFDYTNGWRFDPKEKFLIYAPLQMRRNLPNENKIDSCVLMFCQNSTLYFLKAFMEDSVWQVYQAERKQPILSIPENSDEKDWRWNLSKRYSFSVYYLV